MAESTDFQPEVRKMFPKDWGTVWKEFLSEQENRIWWSRFAQGKEPIYCMPVQLIDALADEIVLRSGERRRTRKELLSLKDASVERAFTSACQRFDSSCVGIWFGRPLVHNLIGPATKFDAVPEKLVMKLKFLNGTAEQRRAKLQSIDAPAAAVQRILRYRAGQLFSLKGFVDELQNLKIAWLRLKENPTFPLLRPSQAESTDTAVRTRATKFGRLLCRFLDRWELARLDSWDLIVPLGPLASAPVSIPLNALGSVTIAKIFPHYWPATIPQETIIARIQLSCDAGTPPITATFKSEPSIYERAYEMRLAEIAVQQRFKKLPRGTSTRLCEAFKHRFGVDEGRINQIRAKYNMKRP